MNMLSSSWMLVLCISIFNRSVTAIRTSSSRSFRTTSRTALTNLQQEDRTFETKSAKQGYKEMVIGGEDAINRLIAKANFLIPPTTNAAEFVRWSREIAKRKLATDQEFRERVKVRELRKQFKQEIHALEQKLLAAKVAFEEDPNSALLYELDRLVNNGRQATLNMEKLLQGGSGTTITLGQGTDDGEKEVTEEDDIGIKEVEEEEASSLLLVEDMNERDNKLAAKIAHVASIYPQKRLELEINMAERARLHAATPTYFAYQQAIKDLEFLFDQIGLTTAEKGLTTVQKKGGQGRNSRGRRFEDTADKVLSEYLIPLLATKNNLTVSDLLIVRNIKLGMASSKGSTAELDSVICVRAERPEGLNVRRGSFCRVLAVVEVKRNSDDIGTAFVGYQKSLAWLAGLRELYDPSNWVTKAYPTGHFERPFLQDYNGESLIFTKESFEGLRRKSMSLSLPDELSRFFCADSSSSNIDSTSCNMHDTSDDSKPSVMLLKKVATQSCSVFAEDLYFVTRDGALDCIQSKAMSWAINKIAGETEFDNELSDEIALEALRIRVEERYPHRMSTLDLLHAFRSDSHLTGQVFVVADEPREDIETMTREATS